MFGIQAPTVLQFIELYVLIIHRAKIYMLKSRIVPDLIIWEIFIAINFVFIWQEWRPSFAAQP